MAAEPIVYLCKKCGKPADPGFTNLCLDCWSQVMTDRYGYDGEDLSVPQRRERFNPIPILTPTESDKEN